MCSCVGVVHKPGSLQWLNVVTYGKIWLNMKIILKAGAITHLSPRPSVPFNAAVAWPVVAHFCLWGALWAAALQWQTADVIHETQDSTGAQTHPTFRRALLAKGDSHVTSVRVQYAAKWSLYNTNYFDFWWSCCITPLIKLLCYMHCIGKLTECLHIIKCVLDTINRDD